MRRRRVAVLAVVALALLSGCAGGGIDRSALAEEATYDFDREATVTIDVQGRQYHALYDVGEVEADQIALSWHSEFRGRQPLSISAVQFRYPNGTVVGADAITVEQRNSRTVVEFPAENGTLAYTAGGGAKTVGTPVTVEGSYEVILPAGMRVGVPLFASVSPGGYEATLADGRVHLRWSETPGGDVSVRYFLERDFYLFTGMVAVLLVVGLVGTVYYRLQIRELERRRTETDLDVEE